MTGSPDSSAVLNGGVNIDLGRRYHGIKRLRATYPFGRLQIAEGQASLWVKSLGTLPRDLPLPLVLTPATACVRVRHGWLPSVTFKTSVTLHHFWTLHPDRTLAALQDVGFEVCS